MLAVAISVRILLVLPEPPIYVQSAGHSLELHTLSQPVL